MRVRLKNWYLEKKLSQKLIVRGNVCNSPKYVNDRPNIISIVKSIVQYDDKDCIEIHTENFVYYCYWSDCDFEACSDVDTYLEELQDVQKKYVNNVSSHMEKDSIVLLYSNKNNFFQHIFIRQEDDIQRIYLPCPHCPFSTSIYTKEGEKSCVEIRYKYTHDYNFKVYYVDIPDNMTLYVENSSEMTIYIDCGVGTIHIAPGERKNITTGYVPDYLELARHNESLPKAWKSFDPQHVLQEIEQNGSKHPEKNYMIVREWHAINKVNVSDERINMIASKGVAMALVLGKYELVGKLLANGATIDLEEPIVIRNYNKSGECMGSAELMLMEWMANDWGIPDDIYTLLWNNAKTNSQWPLSCPLELQLVHEQERAAILANMLLKLKKIWSEAAEELLMALTAYFLKTKVEPGDSAWIPLFREFPTRRRKLIRKIIACYMPTCFSETRKLIMDYWKLYQEYEEAEEQKVTIVYLLQDYMSDICASEELQEWFLPMLLAGIGSLGDVELGSRDASMRILLTRKKISKQVWNELLKTDFVPIVYVDEYIENIAHSDNKYLMPLLISAKFMDEVRV